VKFEAWRAKADQAIISLRQTDEQAAERLKALLMADPAIFKPGIFKMSLPTDDGEESILITGTEKEGPSISANSPDGMVHAAQYAEPVSVGFNTRLCQSSMTRTEAYRQKLWILWTRPPLEREGFVFCVSCSCPQMILATQSLDPSDAHRPVILEGSTNGSYMRLLLDSGGYGRRNVFV
jgi:hypothetical protein